MTPRVGVIRVIRGSFVVILSVVILSDFRRVMHATT
jgi:hypothetical protein